MQRMQMFLLPLRERDSLFEGLNNVSYVIKIRLAMIEEEPYPFQQQRNHTENPLTNKKK